MYTYTFYTKIHILQIYMYIIHSSVGTRVLLSWILAGRVINKTRTDKSESMSWRAVERNASSLSLLSITIIIICLFKSSVFRFFVMLSYFFLNQDIFSRSFLSFLFKVVSYFSCIFDHFYPYMRLVVFTIFSDIYCV